MSVEVHIEQLWGTGAHDRPQAVETIVRDAGLDLLDKRQWFMTSDLRHHPQRPAPSPYTCATTVDGPVIETVVRHRFAGAVARGVMAVVGGNAIADRIETVPEHRRRGLGSVVMSALVEHATAQGATTGILIASADGRWLYSALNWTVGATVLIAETPAETSSHDH